MAKKPFSQSQYGKSSSNFHWEDAYSAAHGGKRQKFDAESFKKKFNSLLVTAAALGVTGVGLATVPSNLPPLVEIVQAYGYEDGVSYRISLGETEDEYRVELVNDFTHRTDSLVSGDNVGRFASLASGMRYTLRVVGGNGLFGKKVFAEKVVYTGAPKEISVAPSVEGTFVRVAPSAQSVAFSVQVDSDDVDVYAALYLGTDEVKRALVSNGLNTLTFDELSPQTDYVLEIGCFYGGSWQVVAEQAFATESLPAGQILSAEYVTTNSTLRVVVKINVDEEFLLSVFAMDQTGAEVEVASDEVNSGGKDEFVCEVDAGQTYVVKLIRYVQDEQEVTDSATVTAI